ncbi:hypothetical protein, partial [Lysinibacillus xylanilyticus]|uniref:hypothetical protein n=1 Tax=Lysinibacillus xylanilyticus TaxID=582475 RepID=UPI00381189D5
GPLFPSLGFAFPSPSLLSVTLAQSSVASDFLSVAWTPFSVARSSFRHLGSIFRRFNSSSRRSDLAFRRPALPSPAFFPHVANVYPKNKKASNK